MDIKYDEASRCFKLDTENTTYMIAVADDEGFIGHAYYGARISDADASFLLRTDEPPWTASKNDRDRATFLDSFPMEYPGCGVGDFREGAVCVRDAHGNSAVHFTYAGYRIADGKYSLPGMPSTFADEKDAKTLELIAEDDVLKLRATLLYGVFADVDAVARAVCIENYGDAPIYLTKALSLALDMDASDLRMLTLHGSWGRERQMEYRDIGYGKQCAGSTRGESSHQEHPFLGLVSKNATQEAGEAYGFHFVYSGNFIAQVEKSQYDSLRVLLGIHPQDFCWKLAPGERFYAPEAICVYSAGGIGAMTRTFHDLYRRHLIRSKYRDKQRPILINNWEATYFDFDSEKLLDIAREAKKCGIEMLVMDDGWFGRRNDDNTSLGDWRVNEEKLPGGLPALVDEVNGIGLQFGIWIEPEMVSPDSDLYRAHPDWAIALPGRRPCRSRNQFVLDFSRADVRDYIYKAISDVLRSANIAYVKWDMNRQLTDLGGADLPPDRQGELAHRYVLGLYDMQERLVTDFPDILLENCSGGGARFDPGMLYYSPQIWCSDDADAIERLKIQEGTALLYPLSTIGAHVSDCPNHMVGRVTPFMTRGRVALAGTFGYELDITRISREDRDMIPAQVEEYHRYHGLIADGDYYRIASYRENGEYDCWGVVSKDKGAALFTYVQVMARPNCHSRRIRLSGLDPERRYTIAHSGKTYHGDTLMHAGIDIPEMRGDFQSMLIELRECV